MDTGLTHLRLAAAPRRITVALTGAAALRGEASAWRALAARAAEPGPFNDPEVTLAALQHLPAGRDVALLVARRGPDLEAVIPLAPPRFGSSEARLWRPDLLPPLGPLVAAERTGEILEALLEGLARDRRATRLVLPGLAAEGPVARALSILATRSGLALARQARRGPIVFAPGDGEGAALRRERRLVLERRLAGLGALRVERGRAPRQIRDAVETFLTLDATSAHRRRPALVADPGAASFLRTATRQLAALRRARAEVLWAGDRPLAVALVALGPGAAWLCRLSAEAGPQGADAAELLTLALAEGVNRQGLDLVDMRPDAPSAAGASLRPTLDIGIETRPGLARAGVSAFLGRRVSAVAAALRWA